MMLVNVKSAIDGLSPLQLAAAVGATPAVEYLLRVGAEVNYANDLECSALHYASNNGHREVGCL